MANWKDQIVDLAGAVVTENTETHMANAVKDIVNKMARINPAMMYMFSSNINNDAGDGFVSFSDNNMILRVARKEGAIYRTCIEAPPAMESDLIDTNSLHSATTEYPRFIRSNSKIYIYPTVTDVNYISVTKVVYGAVSNVTGASDGIISNFPSGMYPMAVCYASIQTLLEKMAETVVQGGLQNIGTMEIDGSPITSSGWDTAGDADLEDPKTYFSVLRHYITTEEDAELSRAQVEKITAYLSWYQMSMEHNKTDYLWMFERMIELKKTYNEYFLPYMPEQKQEEAPQ